MENRKSAKGFGKRGWVMIIQMFLTFFTCFALQNSVNVLAPMLGAQGWNATLITSCYTIGGVITFIVQMAINRAVARRSSIKGAIVFGLIFLVSIFVIGLSKSIVQFAVGYVLMYFSSCMWSLIENGILAGQWFPRKKGVVMGITTFGIPLASGMGSAIIGALAGQKGMLVSFMPFAVIAVIVILMQKFLLADYPEQIGCYRDNDPSVSPEAAKAQIAAEEAAKTTSPWKLSVLLGTKEFWFVCLPVVFLLFGSIGIMTQVTTILLAVDKAFYAAYGVMTLTIISFAAMFGSWLIGFIDTKRGTKTAMIVSCALMVVTGAVALIGTLPAILVSCLFMAFFMGSCSNFTVSASLEFWGGRNYAAVFSYVSPVCSVLGSFGPMAFAILGGRMGYAVCYGIVIAMGALGILMCLLIHKENIQKKEERLLAAGAKAGAK